MHTRAPRWVARAVVCKLFCPQTEDQWEMGKNNLLICYLAFDFISFPPEERGGSSLWMCGNNPKQNHHVGTRCHAPVAPCIVARTCTGAHPAVLCRCCVARPLRVPVPACPSVRQCLFSCILFSSRTPICRSQRLPSPLVPPYWRTRTWAQRRAAMALPAGHHAPEQPLCPAVSLVSLATPLLCVSTLQRSQPTPLYRAPFAQAYTHPPSSHVPARPQAQGPFG